MKSSLNQADLAGCDRLLIPLDAYARRVWDVNLPVADFEVPLQDRIAPIQPFQEVCALHHAHDMRADLRIEGVDMGMPAAPAIAADLKNPVTPPMRMKSGMMRSQAFFCNAK